MTPRSAAPRRPHRGVSAHHQEIRVLFDPDHEYACVWPTHAALVSILKTINEDLPEDAYRAQDFLGWVYQFFVGNPAGAEAV